MKAKLEPRILLLELLEEMFFRYHLFMILQQKVLESTCLTFFENYMITKY